MEKSKRPKFDRSFRQLGGNREMGPEYVYKPDKTDVEHYLGEGGLGQVFKGFAVRKGYKKVAIKKISLEALKKNGNQSRKALIDKEIEVYKKIKDNMNCPNLLKIYEVLRSPNNLYIVLEYCRHGNLAKEL